MYVITDADLLLVRRVIIKVFGITRDHCLFDDAVSIGNEALLKARNIYDTAYNTKFTTLAYGIVFNDVSDLLNSVYGKEFYLHKMALFDDEYTEDVIEYSDVDSIDILENEERIELALKTIRNSPKQHIDILVAYLSGADYKETIKKLGISKDKYYRVINKILKKVKACSQTS